MPLAQLPAAREPSECAKLVPPLEVVDPKGKALKTPSTNSRKIKLIKASEVEPKKTKLLALIIPTARAVEVSVS